VSHLQASMTASRARQSSSFSPAAALAARLETVGTTGTRYALAGVVAWIGAMKFTAYEATAIQGLVANSPLLGWVYDVLDVNGFARVLGVVEIGIALLIGLKPFSARAAATGAGLAVVMFGTTLSFLFSTPGTFEPSLGGFPALSVLLGQFLVKDVVLMTASIWMLADAMKSIVGDGGVGEVYRAGDTRL